MTTKIYVPWQEFRSVEQVIKKSGVKFKPFRKRHTGYEIEFSPADHPLISFLILKYDINIV